MIRYLLSTLFISCCLLSPVQAQEIAGGEIYYELTGPKTYKVTAHIYRKCDGIPLSSINGYVYGDTLSAGITFTRTSIKKINDTCNNPCQNINGVSRPGFEKHSFEATVDFSLPAYSKFISKGICFVHFAIKNGGRVSASTHNGGLFYIDAAVNTCDTFIKKNHSPIFSMEPKFLIGCNQPIEYSPGPLDTSDYDSLAFSIQPLKKGFKDTIAFNKGYAYNIPLTPYCPPTNSASCRALPNAKPPRGFYFDQEFFRIVVTPTVCDEKAYINLRISEYRKDPVTKKMVLIGYTAREMLVQVKSIPDNNNAVLTINPNNKLVNICTKQDQHMQIYTNDDPFLPKQTGLDTTEIFWDQGQTHGTLKVDRSKRERTADLVFKSDTLQKLIRNQYFTIAAYDRTCNVNLVTKTVKYNVFPSKVLYKLNTSMDSCKLFRFAVKSGDSLNTTNFKATATIFDPAGKAVYSANDTGRYMFQTNGMYHITYSVKNYPEQCATVFTDSIIVTNAFLKAQFNVQFDTNVCFSHITNLSFRPSAIPGLTSYKWKNNGVDLNISDSFVRMRVDTISRISLFTTRQDGCTSLQTRIYNPYTPKLELFKDTGSRSCLYSEYQLKANIQQLKNPVTYKWNLNGKDTVLNSETLNLLMEQTTKIKLTVKDDNYCEYKDSLMARVMKEISFSLKKDRQSICQDSLLIISAENLSINPTLTMWIKNDKDTIISKAPAYVKSYTTKSKVKLNVYDAIGCFASDSITVGPIPNPNISIQSVNGICDRESTRISTTVSPYLASLSYQWYEDNNLTSTSDTFFNFNFRKSTTMKVKAGNQGCYNEVEKTIVVHPLPVFEIVSDDFYNRASRIELSTDKAFATYKWFNNASTRKNLFWAYELGAPGKYTVWCNVTDAYGCKGGDTTDIYTNQYTEIKTPSNPGIRVYPNPGSVELTIDVAENDHMTIYNMEGRIVFEQELTTGVNTISTELFAAGLYLIRIGENSVLWTKE